MKKIEKRIVYLGFYDFYDSPVQRKYITSATNKMQYIFNVLNRLGYDVDLLSFSGVTENKLRIYKSEKKIRKGINLFLPPSIGGNNFFTRRINHFLIWIYNLLWLLRKVKPQDVIIAYHSPAYAWMLQLIQKTKKCKVILELEEIYQDVHNMTKSQVRHELEIIDKADGYIFATDLFVEKAKTSNKPYAVIYGTYQVETQRHEKVEDGFIHVVYAGTFDPRKGGASAAASSAAFLDGRYHVHILGFGSPEDEKNLLAEIEKTKKRTEAKITYEGLLKGDEYIEFLQKCHIGLSTQNPEAAFNMTSFPSKILSYLSNGLTVVSIDIKAVKKSGVGHCIYYYKEQTPEKIAEAIKSVTIKDSRPKIAELDIKFESDLDSLISCLK